MKALVAGWFSYASGHATGGDILARDVLCGWLDEIGVPYDIAVAQPFTDGLPLDRVVAEDYTHAFLVCGPFCPGELERDFLLRFAHCRLIGLNLSPELPPGEWNPFDFLIERDSVDAVNPDMVFASRNALPPVVGICLVEPHEEADTDRANAAIEALLARHEAARVAIDTRLDVNGTGLRTPGEIEAIISRVDLLVTTRLHGTVMALKRGVPVLAIDAVPGGGKVLRQCRRIGWPYVFGLDDLAPDALDDTFLRLLSADARGLAQRCSAAAASDTLSIKARLAEALVTDGTVDRNFAHRRTEAGMAQFMAQLPPARNHGPDPGLRARLGRLARRVLQAP